MFGWKEVWKEREMRERRKKGRIKNKSKKELILKIKPELYFNQCYGHNNFSEPLLSYLCVLIAVSICTEGAGYRTELAFCIKMVLKSTSAKDLITSIVSTVNVFKLTIFHVVLEVGNEK